MSTERFEAEVPQEKSVLSGCLLGCAISAGVVLLLLIVGGWWVSRNWRSWTGSLASTVMEAAIEQSNLPPEEQAELMAQVKRVTEAFADGTISNEQMERFMRGLVESPLLTTFVVLGVEAKYLDGSGLTDEEKAAGKTTLMRFTSGVMREQIDEEVLDEVLVHIADKQPPDGEWRLRDQVTDDELRAFLDAAKQHADDAGVPDEIEPVDPSDELQRIIDETVADAA